VAGLCRAPNARLRHDIVVAAVLCALCSVVSTVLLAMLGADGARLGDAVRYAVPAVLVDGLLAVAVVPLVRAFLRSDRLRLPRPVLILGEMA
jgi:hypothetical protein